MPAEEHVFVLSCNFCAALIFSIIYAHVALPTRYCTITSEFEVKISLVSCIIVARRLSNPKVADGFKDSCLIIPSSSFYSPPRAISSKLEIIMTCPLLKYFSCIECRLILRPILTLFISLTFP